MITNQLGKIDFQISIDDYHPGNQELAAAILAAGFIPTFFIETMTPGARQQITDLSRMGIDIGSHTMHHPSDIKRLNPEQTRTEVRESKKQIEEWTGKPCVHFAYPRGRYNDATIEEIKAAGYKSSRTTQVFKQSMPEPFKYGTTIHVCNIRPEYKGRDWLTLAAFYLQHTARHGGTFHIWGHYEEMQREGQLENFINFLIEAKQKL